MKTTPEPPASPSDLPRILLVEDDPTSRAFLGAALHAIPAEVDAVDSLAGALVLAGSRRHDLWLFDAHLPDGDACELLRQASRKQSGITALAHTASDEPAMRETLLAAGFREVLVKPLPASAVQSAVRHALGLDAPALPIHRADDDGDGPPQWDDDAAIAALNGNRSHVDTLRQLFLAELPQTRERILASARDSRHEAVSAELHKLRASCGFVGAARLAVAVQALQSRPDGADALADFDLAAGDLLAQPAAAKPD
ncbi:MAG: Hpt domain-containing response regulator [Lysobacter sp.]